MTVPEGLAAEYARLAHAGRVWLVGWQSGAEVLEELASLVDGLQLFEPLTCDSLAEVRVADVPALAREAAAAGRALACANDLCGAAGEPVLSLGTQLSCELVAPGVVAVAVSRSRTRGRAVAAAPWLVEGVSRALEDRVLGEGELPVLIDTSRERFDAAAVLASYLRCHPAVAAVSYPGLPDHPDRARAASLLVGGAGPLVGVRLLADDSAEALLALDILGLRVSRVGEGSVVLETQPGTDVLSLVPTFERAFVGA